MATRRMMSITEAAQELGISSSTVSRLLTSGKLGHVRSGPRTVKIGTDHLERFMRKGGISSEDRNREA